MATKWLWVGSVDMLDKGVIHAPSGTQQDGTRSRLTTQNGEQFKTYELFISGIFHLIFLDCGWLWVTKTMQSDKGGAGGTTLFSVFDRELEFYILYLI